MKKELEILIQKVGRNTHHLEKTTWWEKNQKIEIYNELKKLYPFVDSIREAIYLKIHCMDTRPHCLQCGNEIKPPKEKVLNGFAKHCSRSCQVKTQQSNIGIESIRERNRKAGKISQQDRDPKTLIYRKEYYIEKYGELEGIIKYNEFLARPTFSKNICIEKYGNVEGMKIWKERQNLWKKKIKSTNIDNGVWMDWDSKGYPDFKLYERKVRCASEKQNLQLLENFDKRSVNGYHLDHKFSIFEGFKHNIPIHIIASLHNLEFITQKENLSKNKKCSITQEELFSLIF